MKTLKASLLVTLIAAVTCLSNVVSAREGLGNLYVRGDKVVCDYTNELCWYPALTDTLDMTRAQQEGFIRGINVIGYGGITNWKMAKWSQVQDLKDSLAGMGEMLTPHEWPWTPPDSERTIASPFNAWPVQVDEFFTPTWMVMDQNMLVPSMMPLPILGGGPIMFFNGRTRGWGWRSGSPLEPPVWAKGEADDHFVTTEFKTEGFATMTWNYDNHYLPDDDTTRPGFPGPFGAWIVSETTPIELHIIFLEDLVTSMDLHSGLENSLLSHLENAGKSTQKDNAEAAINQLEAFISKVETQRDKAITDEQANILIEEAQSIIDLFTNG